MNESKQLPKSSQPKAKSLHGNGLWFISALEKWRKAKLLVRVYIVLNNRNIGVC